MWWVRFTHKTFGWRWITFPFACKNLIRRVKTTPAGHDYINSYRGIEFIEDDLLVTHPNKHEKYGIRITWLTPKDETA